MMEHALSVGASSAHAKSDYEESLHRLSRASVEKHYQAYRDVDWDTPEHQIVAGDPRFCLSAESALGATSWYRALPRDLQARFGLDFMCQTFKYGIGLESTLSRGLLEFVHALPNDSVEYRYAMHELIEECQHSLMFQELIRRAGSDAVSVGRFQAFVDRRIARSGATFPAFFFFCVLAGEIFIFDEHREQLKQRDLHPLVRRIVQYHVTEEARHLHFAELYLQRHAGEQSLLRRLWLRVALPKVLGDAERLMLRPSRRLVKRYAIPRQALREAFGAGTAHEARVRRIAAPVFALLAHSRERS
jgi:hypothetical protein